MSFDPDTYLNGSTAKAAPDSFDPDAFLGNQPAPAAVAEFSPDAFLAGQPPAPKSSAVGDVAKRVVRGAVAGTGHLLQSLGAAADTVSDKLKFLGFDKSENRMFRGGASLAKRGAQAIETDPARDRELKSTFAESAGAAVPTIATAIANPVLGVAAMAGQTGESVREAALAEGDTPELAAEKAKIGRLGGAVMGLIPGGSSGRLGGKLIERVATRAATGGAINATQDAAMQAAIDGKIDWNRVQTAGVVGAGMGLALSAPDAARTARRNITAAPGAAADALTTGFGSPETGNPIHPDILAAGAAKPDIQYTVSQPQPHPMAPGKTIPGYTQIERNVGDGRGAVLEDVVREAMPNPPDWLPTGQYTAAEVEAAIKAGRPAPAPVTNEAAAPFVPPDAPVRIEDGNMPGVIIPRPPIESAAPMNPADAAMAKINQGILEQAAPPVPEQMATAPTRETGASQHEKSTREPNPILTKEQTKSFRDVHFDETPIGSGVEGVTATVRKTDPSKIWLVASRPVKGSAFTEQAVAYMHVDVNGKVSFGGSSPNIVNPELVSIARAKLAEHLRRVTGETFPNSELSSEAAPARELATPAPDVVAPSGSATETVGGQASANVPKGRPKVTLKVGNAPDGEADLLTVIEALGGAPGPSKKRGRTPEYDGYNDAFSRGPARLLRRKGGGGIDTFIPQLEAHGYKFDSVDEFYSAVAKASDNRSKLAKQLGDVEYGAKFDAALMENAGRKAHLDPVEPIASDSLNVGDTFKVRGEPVKVVDIDPDTGATKIRDGVKRELPPGTPIYPDAGTLKQAARAADDFFPGSEAGFIDPAVMAAVGRTGVGAAVGYTTGDTREEKLRNAAIGAGLGLLGPLAFRAAKRGLSGPPTKTRPPGPVAPGGPNKPGAGSPVRGSGLEGSKPLGLIESAKASPEIVPELRKGIEGFYEPQSNAETIAAAHARIDAAPDLQSAKAALLLEESPTAVSQATGLELIRKFQAEGKLQDAADVLYDMSVKAKNQGQAIQILATLSRDTPEGVAAYAQRLFGRKLTVEELAQINRAMERVAAATAPEVKLARTATLLDELARKSGHGAKWDAKASGAMNIAMLLNPKTIIRNIGGNLVMASADLTADMLSPVVDAGVSVFTGRRTVSGPQVLEYARGLGTPARDFRAGYEQARSEGAGRLASFKEGLDTMAVMGKLVSTSKTELGDIAKAYRTTFSSPVMRGFEKTMSVVMGGPDRAFYSGRLRSSLASQMKAEGAAVPTAAMLDRASLEAARAVYQDSNFISTALRDARAMLNQVSTLGKSSRFGAGQAIVPFVQVPGSLLMRGLEYSPAGFLKAAAEAVGPLLPGDRVFNQREFSQAFSKALIGSGAIAGTGYALAKLGIIAGTPETDPKVRALQRSLGFGGYTVNVSAFKRAFQSMDWKTPQPHEAGDLHVSYDWAQPMAFPAAVGASLADSERRATIAGQRGKVIEAPSRVLSALMSGARTLEEQPLLTGLTGFMSSASAASREGAGMVEALATSMATLPGQYVPAAARQVQQLMDNRVYETRGTDKLETAWQSAAANIPGLAESLGFKPRSDILGDLAERYQANGNSFFNVIVNPAFVSHVKTDPQLREIYRLWEHTGNSAPIPGQVDAKVTINGAPKVLTAPERADMQQFVGRVTRDAYKQLMRSEGYANATDEQRAKVLGEVVGAANTVARVQLFGDRPRTMDKWDRALLGLSPGALDQIKNNTATPSK